MYICLLILINLLKRRLKVLLFVIWMISLYWIIIGLFILYTKSYRETNSAYKRSIERGRKFDIKKSGIVFLHLQKTSGKTFEEDVVKNLMVREEKKKTWIRMCKWKFGHRFDCKPSFFSRNTKGWPCKVHPMFNHVRKCYPQKFPKYKDHFYLITLLREPVKRFISEYNHVKRVGKFFVVAFLKR